ncbi:UBP-type zinc finger domain-containing protein [Streptomyces sp. NPDC004667]|uniref:UBP-type zinc finger domain-containing protein n=1 Tax=Streptomyces sp. NPDC004667 TaxID=3154285 RepID=UPI0033AC6C74
MTDPHEPAPRWTTAPDGGRPDGTTCTHLDRDLLPADRGAERGCAACLALGAPWHRLLRCLTCGEVGCCDSSPGRHAHAHAQSSSHPIAESYGSGEDWAWCYLDHLYLVPAAPPGGGPVHPPSRPRAKRRERGDRSDQAPP